jgi:hypothetical protein
MEEDDSDLTDDDVRGGASDTLRLAVILWSELKLAGNAKVPPDARKEMWTADRPYYVRLARRVQARLKRRGLEIMAPR